MQCKNSNVCLVWKLDQLVYLNRQDFCSDSPNWMMALAGSGLKMEGDHLNIEIVEALLICNASNLLGCLEICEFDNQ